MRRTSSMSSSSTCRRPAVSTTSTSRPTRRASSTARDATPTGSVGSLKTGTSVWPPSTRSCSTAAGRWRSAPTSSGLRPCCLNQRASLAAAVVLPEPCRPASSTTVGGLEAYVTRRVSLPRTPTSSSWTIFMTCWAGVRLLESSAPTQRSRMRATKRLTTTKLTSASRRARRISRRTSSTSASPRRPRLRRRPKMPSKRSESDSNMRPTRL